MKVEDEKKRAAHKEEDINKKKIDVKNPDVLNAFKQRVNKH